MNLNWLKDNTIFLTIHGSQAYGLNGPNSDLDIKGICIPPKSVANNLFQKFEQAIDPKFIDEDYWLSPFVVSGDKLLNKFKKEV